MQNVSSMCGKSDNAPLLRFPEFNGEWEEKKLGEIAERVTRKNRNNETDLPLTISSKDGLVDQVTYFNKTVASKDMSGYYLLKNGEFAYNKSYSVGYDFGSVKRLDKYPMGALSTLYICFSIKNFDSDFMKVYFDSLKWYREIYLIAAEGARNHGLLNISTEDFFETKHKLPVNISEQKKIAAFFTLLDRRIQKQRQLVEYLKTYKRGFFRYLLSTFTTREYLLNDIIFEYTEKAASNRQYPILSSTMNGIKLQNSYFNKHAASENTIGYKVVPYGYFTYRSMSDTGEFHFNYQDIIDKGIVSPAYPVFCINEFHNSRFVEYILNETEFIKSQLMIAKEGGTRYALSFSKFQRLRIQLPDKSIQDKVAEQIVLFERKISSEEKILLSYEVQKKQLLKQMFI